MPMAPSPLGFRQTGSGVSGPTISITEVVVTVQEPETVATIDTQPIVVVVSPA